MEKNKSFEIIINDRIDEDSKLILQRYWDFNGTEFLERIGEIGKSYNRLHTQLYQIVRESSVALIKDYCHGCGVELKIFEVRSQTKFIEYYHGENNCTDCQKIENEKIAKQRAIAEKLYNERRAYILEEAVKESSWLQLSLEENRLLLSIIESPSQNIDFSNYQTLHQSQMIELIDKLISTGLIDGGSEIDMDDNAFGFSPRLPEKLRTYLKEFEIQPDKHFSASWSRISFELKRNKRHTNRDTPLQSGTITFEEDVVIRAGTKCLYGVWGRENENAWLSITPVSDIIVSQNKSIDSEPEPLKSILKRILRQ